MIIKNSTAHSLADKSILVTGASSGIGRATVAELAKRGARVFAGVRCDDDYDTVAAISGNVTSLMLDITDAEQISQAAETIGENVADCGLDGVINNAGFACACPLEFLPLDQLRRQLEVNVVGQLAITQAMLSLVRQACGRIININSLSGHVAGPYVGPYAASKHAFAAMNDSLRLELRNFGINVVQIIPGDIATPIWQKSRKHADRLRDRIADDLSSKLPRDVREKYTSDIQAMRRATDNFAANALPVTRVVDAILKAMSAERPKPRYVVGARAWGAVYALSRLPTYLRDSVVLKNLGMKS